MANELRTIDPQVLQSIILTGDVSSLKGGQKVDYVLAMCDRLGLDPITQPLKILRLEDKKRGTVREIVYADRGCAAQLNEKRNLSHQIVSSEQVEDIYVVTDRCTSPDGRFTDEVGAVSLSGWEGKALSGTQKANAIMHARTKAMRRSTLTHVGLGMLDETEAKDIPNSTPVDLGAITTGSVQVEWTDDERTEARAMVADLAEALLEAGMEDAAMREAIGGPSMKIGDVETSYHTWANRLLGYRERQLLKLEKAKAEVPVDIVDGFGAHDA